MISGFALLMLAAVAPARAEEEEAENAVAAVKIPAPALSAEKPEQRPEAVTVPETLGVSLLAGAGFLFLLRRRRFS